jgi:murein DD-endopeptidase MepM/ murein hydrolase activator NlpD
MSGVITQGFGPSQIAIEPALSLAGISYRHFHTGIDIAAPFATPVLAAGNGVVALAGSETDGFGHLVGYGNYVVIAHGGGMITLYGHLDRILVQPGQPVQAGVPIGLEGSTGNSTGPHVHFELRVDGIPTDPRAYVAPA